MIFELFPIVDLLLISLSSPDLNHQLSSLTDLSSFTLSKFIFTFTLLNAVYVDFCCSHVCVNSIDLQVATRIAAVKSFKLLDDRNCDLPSHLSRVILIRTVAMKDA